MARQAHRLQNNLHNCKSFCAVCRVLTMGNNKFNSCEPFRIYSNVNMWRGGGGGMAWLLGGKNMGDNLGSNHF